MELHSKTMYISATLQDAIFYDYHVQAIENWRTKTAELKGVFSFEPQESGERIKVKPLNFSGDIFDHRSYQLKLIAEAKANNESLLAPSFVYIQTLLGEKGDKIERVATAIAFSDEERERFEEMGYFTIKEKNEMSCYYPLRQDIWDEMTHEDDDMFSDLIWRKGHYTFRIGEDRPLTFSRFGENFALTEPIQDETEAVNKVRIALEILDELVSLGINPSNILPHPDTNSFSLRDPDAEDVWIHHKDRDEFILKELSKKERSIQSMLSDEVGEKEKTTLCQKLK